ncbi:MAG: DUF2079 domain-containing protein [Candidatus Rokubacteria bacterium]|nr:DUF2079 domain-containing protein [Candidatus Rokubacteria bacterium]MBI3827374.1 DUF2079 domain-containing protein [Candidatus Rokubacteria bacterium]
MTATVRVLDGLAVVIALALLVMLATGVIALGAAVLDRPEDLLVALVVVVATRAWLRPIPLPAVRPGRAVALGVVVYVLVMSFIALTRHAALRSHALDLGQYLQIVWNIAHGRGPVSTVVPTYMTAERMHAWGDHFSPVFYLLAPLQRVAPGAASLLLAQTVILAAGAPVVYRWATRVLGDPRAAAAFALLYLVSPSLQGINARDIHPAAFAIPLLLAAAWAVDAGRWGWGVAALVLTLACREDAAVAVVGFAVWLALARRRHVAAAVVAAAALAVLAVDVSLLMPRFRGGAYVHLGRYAHLGTSLGGIVVSLALRPWRWIAIGLTPARLVYLGALLLPLALLPLRAPLVAAAAVPGLAINLLALDPKLVDPQAQYQAFVLPFLVLAAVEGYRRLRDERWRRLALPAAFALSLVLTARTANDLSVRFWGFGDVQRGAYALMARVPAGAAISANERLVPHLATRPEVHVFPRGLDTSEYVLEMRSAAARVPSDRYAVVASADPWVLWQRSGSGR